MGALNQGNTVVPQKLYFSAMKPLLKSYEKLESGNWTVKNNEAVWSFREAIWSFCEAIWFSCEVSYCYL